MKSDTKSKATTINTEIPINPNFAYLAGEEFSEVKSAAYEQIEDGENEDAFGYTLIDEYIEIIEKQGHSRLADSEIHSLGTPQQSELPLPSNFTDTPVSEKTTDGIHNRGLITAEANPTLTRSAKVHEDYTKDDEIEMVVLLDNPAYAVSSDIFGDNSHLAPDNSSYPRHADSCIYQKQ